MDSAVNRENSNSRENGHQPVEETTSKQQLNTAEDVVNWYTLIVNHVLEGTFDRKHLEVDCSDEVIKTASSAFTEAIESEVHHWEDLMSLDTGKVGNSKAGFPESNNDIRALAQALEKVIQQNEKAKQLCGLVVGRPAWEKFLIFYLRTAIKTNNWRRKGELDKLVDKMFTFLKVVKKETDLHSMLKDCEIPQNFIAILNKHSSSYVMPRSGAEKRGLIYWVMKKADRPPFGQPDDGSTTKATESKKFETPNLSVNEKEIVEKWMKKNSIRLTNKSHKSFNGADFFKDLEDDITEVSKDCSALVVFILAEGTEGYVYGADHRRVEIAQIRSKIQTLIHGNLPKVLIVCACRRPTPNDAKAAITSVTNQQPADSDRDARNYMEVSACTQRERALVHFMIPKLLDDSCAGMEFKEAVSKTGREIDGENTVEMVHCTLHRHLYLKSP